jgi:hypothetical protein
VQTVWKLAGPAALIHYLSEMDLTGFNVFKAPDTDDLVKQQIEGLKHQELYIYQMLEDGSIPDSQETENEGSHHWDEDGLFISKKVLFDLYRSWTRTTAYQANSTLTVGRFTKKLIEELIPSAYTRRVGPRGRMGRIMKIQLPPLDVCRSEFAKYIGGNIDWSDDQLTDDDSPDDYEEDDLG